MERKSKTANENGTAATMMEDGGRLPPNSNSRMSINTDKAAERPNAFFWALFLSWLLETMFTTALIPMTASRDRYIAVCKSIPDNSGNDGTNPSP